MTTATLTAIGIGLVLLAPVMWFALKHSSATVDIIKKEEWL